MGIHIVSAIVPFVGTLTYDMTASFWMDHVNGVEL